MLGERCILTDFSPTRHLLVHGNLVFGGMDAIQKMMIDIQALDRVYNNISVCAHRLSKVYDVMLGGRKGVFWLIFHQQGTCLFTATLFLEEWMRFRR